MKKPFFYLVTILFVITSYSNSFGGGSDGYAWKEFDSSTKAMTMSGYINGYVSGEMIGFMKGIAFCNSSVDMSEADGNVFFNKSKQKYLTLSFSKEIKDGRFYANEVDAFLQTYPLCSSKEFSELLLDLTEVWFDKQSGATYKTIGESCVSVK